MEIELNILSSILIILFLTSCSGFTNQDTESLEFDSSSKENETFFIDAENDQLSQSINISDESIHTNVATLENIEMKYKVVKGDTLGIIAVKIFGDFRRWRHIFSKNKSIIHNGSIEPGTYLNYNFEDSDKWTKPSGTPYLVLKNDNLGIISKNVYNGEKKHWRYIWKNNKKLIYNPNLIFSGFTIYYLPLSQKVNLARK